MRKIEGAERDALVLHILKRLDGSLPHATAYQWEANWESALAQFRANPVEESLVPGFIPQEQPLRKNGAFWDGVSELEYVRGLQAWVAWQLADCDYIYEFGCGTGFNLVALAQLMPGRAFVGMDRSSAAVQLVAEAAEALCLPIMSGRFDMLEPRPAKMPEGAGVFTLGAMEQLGRFQPFIEWLIEQRPAKVVHMEPIPELLDENVLIDWLSLEFHRKRGYTVGLLPYLQAHPGIEVLEVERSYFGSLMLESYAKVVWKPR